MLQKKNGKPFNLFMLIISVNNLAFATEQSIEIEYNLLVMTTLKSVIQEGTKAIFPTREVNKLNMFN